MSPRFLQFFDGWSLYLVPQAQAKNDLGPGAHDRHLQHQVLLRWSEVYPDQVGPNSTILRRRSWPIRQAIPRQGAQLRRPGDEKVLVNVCLHGMNDEYRVFLENLNILILSEADGGHTANEWISHKDT